MGNNSGNLTTENPIQITLSDDKMHAYLTLKEPEKGKDAYTEKEYLLVTRGRMNDK